MYKSTEVLTTSSTVTRCQGAACGPGQYICLIFGSSKASPKFTDNTATLAAPELVAFQRRLGRSGCTALDLYRTDNRARIAARMPPRSGQSRSPPGMTPPSIRRAGPLPRPGTGHRLTSPFLLTPGKKGKERRQCGLMIASFLRRALRTRLSSYR